MDKSLDMADAVRPTKFTATIRLSDWAPTFLNYVRLIPGRDVVPLSYVYRNSNGLDSTPNVDAVLQVWLI